MVYLIRDATAEVVSCSVCSPYRCRDTVLADTMSTVVLIGLRRSTG